MEDLEEMHGKVMAVLNEVRGALQADGGDLELVSIDGKVVTLKLQGHCGCCPHAMATLKNYVEVALRENVDPEITVERAE